MEFLVQRKGFLYRWTNWSALIGLGVMVLLAIGIVVDVLLRWVFSAPIDGLDDVNQLIMAIVLAACFPAVLIQDHNITIRFLGAACGKRTSQGLEVFGAIGTLIFFVFIGWQLVVLSQEMTRDSRITEIAELPMAPWWWLTSALMITCVPVQFAILGVRIWRLVAGNQPE